MKSSVISAGLCLTIALALPALSQEKPVFNQDKAWEYLLKQCSFGPRNPGSQGHLKCGDYLVTELKKFTSDVSEQPFTFRDRRLRKTYNMRNIIADFSQSAEPKILLCAHWDCRPWSDRDPNPENRGKPILGANDGASGVAVLLEMARIFAAHPPPLPMQIIFFDGEDYGREGEIWDYLLGSKHFAKTADPSEYRFAVLLDLIGDEDLEIKREYNSFINCRALQDKIWRIAARVGSHQFSPRMTGPITDDHLPLIEIGIPAVDIIDLEYRYWHTQEDTPEHCSIESLKAVGDVLVELIYVEENP